MMKKYRINQDGQLESVDLVREVLPTGMMLVIDDTGYQYRTSQADWSNTELGAWERYKAELDERYGIIVTELSKLATERNRVELILDAHKWADQPTNS